MAENTIPKGPIGYAREGGEKAMDSLLKGILYQKEQKQRADELELKKEEIKKDIELKMLGTYAEFAKMEEDPEIRAEMFKSIFPIISNRTGIKLEDLPRKYNRDEEKSILNKATKIFNNPEWDLNRKSDELTNLLTETFTIPGEKKRKEVSEAIKGIGQRIEQKKGEQPKYKGTQNVGGKYYEDIWKDGKISERKEIETPKDIKEKVENVYLLKGINAYNTKAKPEIYNSHFVSGGSTGRDILKSILQAKREQTKRLPKDEVEKRLVDYAKILNDIAKTPEDSEDAGLSDETKRKVAALQIVSGGQALHPDKITQDFAIKIVKKSMDSLVDDYKEYGLKLPPLTIKAGKEETKSKIKGEGRKSVVDDVFKKSK